MFSGRACSPFYPVPGTNDEQARPLNKTPHCFPSVEIQYASTPMRTRSGSFLRGGGTLGGTFGPRRLFGGGGALGGGAFFGGPMSLSRQRRMRCSRVPFMFEHVGNRTRALG